MFSCFLAGIFFVLCLQSLSHNYIVPAFVEGLLAIECLTNAVKEKRWREWFRKDNKDE